MCSISMALPAIQVLSSVVDYSGQKSAASAQERQIRKGQQLQDAAFVAQRTDIQDAAEGQIADRVKQAAREKGALRVAQGESGLAGVTFDRLENDISFQSGVDITRIKTNARKQTESTKRNQSASNHRSRSNALQINRPSLVGTGLQIGTSVAGGIRDFNKTKPITKNSTT